MECQKIKTNQIQKRNKNAKMFNDIKNQKKQLIFEDDIKGSSLLDENQIQE